MTSDALPNVDAQNTGNIELLEYPSYDNFLQSSSAFAVRNLNRTPSRERLCVRLWVRVENSFVDWWMGELLAILLSLIALFAIIFILCKYDGHICQGCLTMSLSVFCCLDLGRSIEEFAAPCDSISIRPTQMALDVF